MTAEGKLNIMGVFQVINAPQFPYVHPQMHLVLTLEAHRSEVGKKKQIEIRLMSEDGLPLFSVGGETEVPKAPGDPRIRVYIHERYSWIRDTVSRHGRLPIGYIGDAIKNVDEVLRLDAENKE